MRKTLTIWAMLCGVALCSCNKAADFSYEDIENADTLTHHAKYLTIADCGAGVVRVDIANPWRENHILASYALVDRDSLVPENLAPDIRVIRTPVDRAAVFSSVHTHALQELGALPSVVAIADRVLHSVRHGEQVDRPRTNYRPRTYFFAFGRTNGCKRGYNRASLSSVLWLHIRECCCS